MSKNISVYAVFPDSASLEWAVTTLEQRGFRQEDVSVLLPDNPGNKDLLTRKNSKGPEGAVAGGATGGVVGGALGWLAGIGAIAIPGLGPFIAAGPIIAMMAGAGAGASVGGVAGGLIGLGLPEFETKRYEGRVKNGGSLLSVHCDNDDWARRAEDILVETGGEDITKTGEAAADYDKTDVPHSRGAGF
jgi:hypothetical protein